MGYSVPQLYQPRRLMDSLGSANALAQDFMKTRAMPQQIKNQLALQAAQARQAENESQYGSGQYGSILTALNNPRLPKSQRDALETALTINSLYRPGMPNDPTTQAVRTSAIGGSPNLSGQITEQTGMTPMQLLQQQLEQYSSKTAQQAATAKQKGAQADIVYPAQADEERARANYYDKGGARGSFIANLLSGKYGDTSKMPDGMLQQAIAANVLQGATPESKRFYEYQAAEGNPTLQSSIKGANLKATSNQQLLRQQAAMEQFDSALQPMLQNVGDAVAYYSGPSGALKLRKDQLQQSLTGTSSPQYQDYMVALQTQIPMIADNARKVLGSQASDAMNQQLQGIVGPGDKPNMTELALMPPQVVYQKLTDFSNYLQRESQVGRNFIGPTDLTQVKEYKGYSADDIAKLMKAQGISYDQAKSYINEAAGGQ